VESRRWWSDRVRVNVGYACAVVVGVALLIPANLIAIIVSIRIVPLGDAEGIARAYMLGLLAVQASAAAIAGAVAATRDAPILGAVLAGAAGPTLAALFVVVVAADGSGSGMLREIFLTCLVPALVAFVGAGVGVVLRHALSRGIRVAGRGA